MRLVKWAIVFVFSFAVSLVVVTTFVRPAFRAPVSAGVFGYTTPAFPMYYYIVGAFLTGLAIGLLVAFYNFFSRAVDSSRKGKRIKQLEKEVDFLSDQRAAEAAPGARFQGTVEPSSKDEALEEDDDDPDDEPRQQNPDNKKVFDDFME